MRDWYRRRRDSRSKAAPSQGDVVGLSGGAIPLDLPAPEPASEQPDLMESWKAHSEKARQDAQESSDDGEEKRDAADSPFNVDLPSSGGQRSPDGDSDDDSEPEVMPFMADLPTTEEAERQEREEQERKESETPAPDMAQAESEQAGSDTEVKPFMPDLPTTEEAEQQEREEQQREEPESPMPGMAQAESGPDEPDEPPFMPDIPQVEASQSDDDDKPFMPDIPTQDSDEKDADETPEREPEADSGPLILQVVDENDPENDRKEKPDGQDNGFMRAEMPEPAQGQEPAMGFNALGDIPTEAEDKEKDKEQEDRRREPESYQDGFMQADAPDSGGREPKSYQSGFMQADMPDSDKKDDDADMGFNALGDFPTQAEEEEEEKKRKQADAAAESDDSPEQPDAPQQVSQKAEMGNLDAMSIQPKSANKMAGGPVVIEQKGRNGMMANGQMIEQKEDSAKKTKNPFDFSNITMDTNGLSGDDKSKDGDVDPEAIEVKKQVEQMVAKGQLPPEALEMAENGELDAKALKSLNITAKEGVTVGSGVPGQKSGGYDDGEVEIPQLSKPKRRGGKGRRRKDENEDDEPTEINLVFKSNPYA